MGPPTTEVDVWVADAALAGRLPLRERLSSEERARADRFRFARDHDLYTVAHAALRDLLGRALSRPPDSLVFRALAHGKPALTGAGHKPGFNLSHSGERVLIALSSAGEVGVDIERVRPMSDLLGVARRFFSEAEVRGLLSLPDPLREEAFFRCWARKEAFVKALGEGLSCPLGCFDVTLGPAEPARLVATRPDPAVAGRYSLAALEVDPGYHGALVVEGALGRLTQHAWVGPAT